MSWLVTFYCSKLKRSEFLKMFFQLQNVLSAAGQFKSRRGIGLWLWKAMGLEVKRVVGVHGVQAEGCPVFPAASQSWSVQVNTLVAEVARCSS